METVGQLTMGKNLVDSLYQKIVPCKVNAKPFDWYDLLSYLSIENSPVIVTRWDSRDREVDAAVRNIGKTVLEDLLVLSVWKTPDGGLSTKASLLEPRSLEPGGQLDFKVAYESGEPIGIVIYYTSAS